MIVSLSNNGGAPRQGSLCSALRAACGGCAMHRPAGLVTRELSPKATEGEKMSDLHQSQQRCNSFSPPVTACAVPAPSSEGAFGALHILRQTTIYRPMTLSNCLSVQLYSPMAITVTGTHSAMNMGQICPRKFPGWPR